MTSQSFCRKNICLVATLLFLAMALGCSTPPQKQYHKPGFSESFDTEITKDGAKFFTYQIEIAGPNALSKSPKTKKKRKSNGYQRNKPGAMNNGQKRTNRLEDQLEAALKNKLEHSGFCLQGYLVLDRYTGHNRARIKGECREGAYDNNVDEVSQ